MKEKLQPYTTTPRYIAEDVRSGKMTPSEWRIYQWLRINASPYGISTTSISSLQNDIYPGVSDNHINRILISLRSKKYLYFDNRRGRRGSFDVHFGDWPLPNQKIRTLDKYFSKKGVRTPEEVDMEDGLEVGYEVNEASQMLEQERKRLTEHVSMSREREEIRTSYNETDHENDHNDTLEKSMKYKTAKEFQPKNHEEERCKEIAEKVGEKYMNSILRTYKRHGLPILLSAFEVFMEDRGKGKMIDNPPAYFQGIVKNMLQKTTGT